MRPAPRLFDALLLTTLVTTALLAGCRDAPSASEAARADRPAGPALAISDGARGGTAGFYFLPPMVPEPTYSGTFDGTRSPEVRVCALTGGSCGQVVASFSGSQVVVDPLAESYQVNWKTKGAGLSATTPYRLEVLVGTTVLGHADLVVIATGSQAKGIDRGQLVVVLDGPTLPIRFRIESGAVPPPPPPTGSWQAGNFITLTQVAWGEPSATNPTLFGGYNSVYGSGGVVEIGIPGAAGFSVAFTLPIAVSSYLPATGLTGPFTADLLNPTSTASGQLGGEVLGLQFNVDFADAGVTLGTSGIAFGDLTLCDLGAPVDGISVRAFLALANTALGGGSTSGISYNGYVSVASTLNGAFSEGTPTQFAQDHLVDGACPADVWQPGAATTYGQGVWDIASTAAGTLLIANFSTVYPGGLEVGLIGAAGFAIAFSSASVVINFLPGIGPNGPLTSDLSDPATSPAGVFAGDVVALTLNVDFADAGLLPGTANVRFGDFVLCGFDTLPQLDGLTVRQFLALMHTLLGGGSGPYGIAEVAPVLSELNFAFFPGFPVSDFAQEHLVLGACP